jgi:L-ascorbate metabolism protein UlaG (beta-lactamase superfamily)
MELHWLGHACFRLRGRTATVVTDPYHDGAGAKLGQSTADVITVSHEHAGHNNVAAIGGTSKVLRGPGEYEVRGVAIAGVQTAHDGVEGREGGRNTIFAIDLDDVSICHLGDLGHVPTAEQVEAIGRVDVLLVPVGPSAKLSAMQAAEVVNLVEPRIVVPMHYEAKPKDGAGEAVAAFCRQLGAEVPAPQARLQISGDALPEGRKVALLEPRRG